MNVKFLPEAHAELLDAVAYYEGELSGLGLRLWEEVDQHIAWIERNYEVPRLRPVRSRTRKSYLPKGSLKRRSCN